MIFNKQKQVNKFSEALEDLNTELKKSKNRQKDITDIANKSKY